MSAVKILLYGPPGAGKDTQGVRLADHFSVPFIPVGELCRNEIAEGSALGDYIAPYMAKGIIAPGAPEALTREQIEQKGLGTTGYVMNGFRTIATLEHFLAYDRPTFAIHLRVSDEVIRSRMAARGRTDDTDKIIARRLAQYHEEGEKALCCYRARCPEVSYKEIDGAGTEDEVFARMLKAIDKT